MSMPRLVSSALALALLVISVPLCATEDIAAELAELKARLAQIEATANSAAASVSSATFNAGDNAWVLLSAILVLFMIIPGLALFYGGLVRKRNVLGTMMQSLAITAVVSVLWAVCGFGLTFSGGSPFIGTDPMWFLQGVAWGSGGVPGPNADYAASIPFGTFALFQLMFAAITPAVICGAYAERMSFRAMLMFSVGWLFLVYVPTAHMVWGKDGLLNWGFGATTTACFDFAGGTVVETASGVSGLMCALFLGHRRNYLREPMPPHNLAFAFTGACLLWVGWFGFNAGSALSASGLATLASINTQLAASAATITWPLAEWIVRGKPTVLGAISGAVAGLVAITPACGFVTPGSALFIGAVGGVLCFVACAWLKMKLRYDDALDVFGVHGVAGMWGTIATGLFFAAEAHPGLKVLNPGLYASIVSGTHHPVTGQLIGVGIAAAVAGVGSTLVLALVKATIGLRISADHEQEGLDLTQHGEEAYNDRE
jgi:Amt family ammonium transporter